MQSPKEDVAFQLVQEPQDSFVPLRDAESGVSRRARGQSYRTINRHTSRQRLSKLESMIHEEHSKALIPTNVMYVTVLISLLGTFQEGWMLSQLNYKYFDSNCQKDPIPDGDCIMFPGHSKHEWTMNVTSWIVGGMIGALFSGIPADKFGRKRTIFLGACVMITGAIIQVCSNTIYVFSFGRMISGISSGLAINVDNVLITEIAPANLRGLFSTGLQVGIALGSLSVTTAHYALNSETYSWRILVGFPIVLGALQILLNPLMTHSPVWLVSQGKIEEAGKELRRLYKPCNYDAILEAIVESHEEEQRELTGINPWAALFSAKYRKQLIIAVVLCSAQQLTGVDAIMYYSSSIFSIAGLSDPRVGNTIINIIRTTFILVAAKIMDKFNRKTLLCTGMTFMAIASGGVMYSLSHTVSAGCVGSLALFMAAFCLSIGPMAWMVSTEIFPDFLHANAGSTGEVFTWLGNFLVGVFYPVVSSDDKLGNNAFGIFVGLNMLFVAFVWFYVPETAHKTYVEIQKSFGIEEPPIETPSEDDPWNNEKKE
ncbi:unnamed protein product [Aphanomyces euteiches]|uniref:Hexose transporter 1 n=1 Tax=Aphanomyces euteiches TaxID=100861 RepID=A0A6G0XY25_9STRA|nr:hypothetical protein Ae201684_000103 [Aphanomyces euteiches]KAH9091843.1 hypothetical protein Ae201684P_011386 [Aphanomyces euteiches]KAH9146280.1 hypothetical protein AeRB84_009867 [Aphanomyces euteiches]